MGEATAEWVFQEVEHREELHRSASLDAAVGSETHLARRHMHMVTKPASDDRIVHDTEAPSATRPRARSTSNHSRLVRLVLKVAVPPRPELRVRPRVHLFELLLRRTDLDTGFDTVGGERTSAVDVPLVVELVLGLLVATNKVIERLDMWLGAVGGEGEVWERLATIRSTLRRHRTYSGLGSSTRHPAGQRGA